MEVPVLTEETKARRAARIEQVKAAFLEGLRRHPGFDGAAEVTLADDAMIDLYATGILDSPEAEFAEFLTSLRTAPNAPEPVDE